MPIDAVGPPTWRRSATWASRGLRRLQHERVVYVRITESAPPISGDLRTVEETEVYIGARWWRVHEVLMSTERFYPGRLPQLLVAVPVRRWRGRALRALEPRGARTLVVMRSFGVRASLPRGVAVTT